MAHAELDARLVIEQAQATQKAWDPEQEHCGAETADVLKLAAQLKALAEAAQSNAEGPTTVTVTADEWAVLTSGAEDGCQPADEGHKGECDKTRRLKGRALQASPSSFQPWQRRPLPVQDAKLTKCPSPYALLSPAEVQPGGASNVVQLKRNGSA